MNYKLLILVVLICLAAFAIGYSTGFVRGSYTTMVWGIKLADHFIESMEFDEEAIAAGIFNYKNNINNCFEIQELENASILNE